MPKTAHPRLGEYVGTVGARDVARVVESIKMIADPNRESVLAACRQLAKWQPELFYPDSEALR